MFWTKGGAFIPTHSKVNPAIAVGNVYNVFKPRNGEYGRFDSISAARNGQFDGETDIVVKLGVRRPLDMS